ncbi:MAG: iron-sulfur cluster biosynthesis family protein [Dokdonella sp.]
MIELSEAAREHFEKLIAQQDIAQLGIRLRAVDAGTPKGDCQLEFCEPSDLRGDEWTMTCGSFSLYVEAASVVSLQDATIDYAREATGGQLSIKAPNLRGAPPDAQAGLFERVAYVIQTEINPQLASHNGR